MIDVPADFRSQLTKVFNAGLKSGDIEFTKTEVSFQEEDGIRFEIRFAPALGHKPIPKDSTKKKEDPFAPPYGPNSFVCNVTDSEEGEDFVILLNKFCVVEEHFLLCTKDFQPQSLPPSPAELYISLCLLNKFTTPYEQLSSKPHVAFFNCGQYSGASQAHKHLQFVSLYTGTLPLQRVIEESRPPQTKIGENWSMPDSVLSLAHYIADTSQAASMSPRSAKEYLTTNLLSLIDSAIDNLRRLSAAGDASVPPKISQMSYNLILTPHFMMLVPRSRSDYLFEDGTKLSVNALGFAGMIMTKYREQLESVQAEGVKRVLQQVGIPMTREESSIIDEPVLH